MSKEANISEGFLCMGVVQLRAWLKTRLSAQRLTKVFDCINQFFVLLFPLVRMGVFLTLLCLIGFMIYMAPRYKPWHDEMCMLEPAVYMAQGEMPQSHAFMDALHVRPYAPNYPLHMGLLTVLIRLSNFNFFAIRYVNLLLISLSLVWICRILLKKSVFKSGGEAWLGFLLMLSPSFVIHSAMYVRPESTAMAICTFLVALWMSSSHWYVLLGCFGAGFLVVWCGLQWVVLMGGGMACVWLFFGGNLKKAVLCAMGMLMGMAVFYFMYRAMGMWESYQQEAARVGGLDVVQNIIAKWGQLGEGNARWLLHPYHLSRTFLKRWTILFACVCFSRSLQLGAIARRWAVFACTYTLGAVLVLAIIANIWGYYYWIFAIPMGVAMVLCLRDMFPRHAWLVTLFLCLLCLSVKDSMMGLRYHTDPFRHRLHLAKELDAGLKQHLMPTDVVMCNDAAYYATRKYAGSWYPLRFSLEEDFPSDLIDVVVLANHDIRSQIFKSIASVFWDRLDVAFGPDSEIAVDDFLCHLAVQWQCEFIEEPFLEMDAHGEAGYRIFRKVQSY